MRDWWDRHGDKVLEVTVGIVGFVASVACLAVAAQAGAEARRRDDEFTDYCGGMVLRETGRSIPHGASRAMRDGAADWHTLMTRRDAPFRRPESLGRFTD